MSSRPPELDVGPLVVDIRRLRDRLAETADRWEAMGYPDEKAAALVGLLRDAHRRTDAALSDLLLAHRSQQF